jgi:hypothetical protein
MNPFLNFAVPKNKKKTSRKKYKSRQDVIGLSPIEKRDRPKFFLIKPMKLKIVSMCVSLY